jgi:hypothetical protein
MTVGVEHHHLPYGEADYHQDGYRTGAWLNPVISGTSPWAEGRSPGVGGFRTPSDTGRINHGLRRAFRIITTGERGDRPLASYNSRIKIDI